MTTLTGSLIRPGGWSECCPSQEWWLQVYEPSPGGLRQDSKFEANLGYSTKLCQKKKKKKCLQTVSNSHPPATWLRSSLETSARPPSTSPACLCLRRGDRAELYPESLSHPSSIPHLPPRGLRDHWDQNQISNSQHFFWCPVLSVSVQQ